MSADRMYLGPPEHRFTCLPDYLAHLVVVGRQLIVWVRRGQVRGVSLAIGGARTAKGTRLGDGTMRLIGIISGIVFAATLSDHRCKRPGYLLGA